MRPQPMLAVHDVESSSRWFQRLLGCKCDHGGPHHHASIGNPDAKPFGNGVLLWFEIDDFVAAMIRIGELNAEIEMPRNRNPPDGKGGPIYWECWLAIRSAI